MVIVVFINVLGKSCVQYCNKTYGIFLSAAVVFSSVADAAPSYRHINGKALIAIEKTYGKTAKNRIKLYLKK